MNAGFMDYMEFVCAFLATVEICVCYTAMVLGKTLIFKTFDNMENLLNTRKPILKLLIQNFDYWKMRSQLNDKFLPTF